MRIDRGRKRRLALAQATRLNPRAPEVVQFLLAPGSLNAARSYNDAWRGWPVAPVHRQHHVRSAFLDPRRGTLAAGGEAAYHIGIDIAVRDDRPEPGAPPGRTHRVYAIEGGYVFLPPRQHARACVNRRVAIGHFDYWHVDTVGVVAEGEQIRPGQMIGWTCKGLNHVHLSETMVLDGRLVYVNPLHGGWKLAPYTDREPPRIHAIRFFGTAMPAWRPWPRLSLPEAGIRFSRMRAGHIRVSGYVDVRAWIDDDGSPPYSIALEVVRERDNKRVLRRTVFRSAVLLTDRLVTQPVPIGYHYAPGTVAGAAYWFRLFARPGGAYWRTESVPNGNYRLEVTARDVAGNVATATARVTVAN
jgi:hypothetical protein